MQNDPRDHQRARENMLAIALAAGVGGMILFFLYLISFGIVGNVLIGAGLVALVMVFHYLAWGRSLSDEVAPERESLGRQALHDPGRKTKAPPDAIQDLSVTQGIRSDSDA